jgi:putative hydrolases of HD superfamily
VGSPIDLAQTPGWPEGRLGDQLRFLIELDRLKQVIRRNRVDGGSRRENTAEHSWHLAMFAIILAEHSPQPIDVPRVVAMLLVHDIVEIDAGDTYIYDVAGRATQVEREERAADRIFGLLPADQRDELRGLWDEFEAMATPEARFAKAMDRLQPLLLNVASAGVTWREHGITAPRVRAANAVAGDVVPAVAPVVEALVAEGVRRGWLSEEP